MIVNGINTEDITLVVQGPVNRNCTASCLASYRKYLPGAKIILSTWEGSKVEDLDYDEVILNKDPGNFIDIKTSNIEHYNNVDRQIVSTINGLKLVKTKYAFKIRTDFQLINHSFLGYFDKYIQFNSKFKIISKRILICTTCTRNPTKTFKFPFHISDFVFFGTTDDLVDLFDIPLTKDSDKNWCLINKKNRKSGEFLCRFTPEQYIFISFLKKHGVDVKCEYYDDYSNENIELTKLYIVNNFTLLNTEQFNLLPFKREFLTTNNINYLNTCYTHYDFLKMYKKYCNNFYFLPSYDKERCNSITFYKIVKRKILKPFVNIICIFIKNRNLKNKIRQIYQ